MQTRLKKTTLAVLPVVGLLLTAPVTSAHDTWRDYTEHSAVHRDLNRAHARQHQQLNAQYDRAMRRLARQEREAKDRAYWHYDGNIYDPGYRAQIARIERQYAYKRAQVARNLGWEHREGHQDLNTMHRDYHEYNVDNRHYRV
jgi:hypothetical protein